MYMYVYSSIHHVGREIVRPTTSITTTRRRKGEKRGPIQIIPCHPRPSVQSSLHCYLLFFSFLPYQFLVLFLLQSDYMKQFHSNLQNSCQLLFNIIAWINIHSESINTISTARVAHSSGDQQHPRFPGQCQREHQVHSPLPKRHPSQPFHLSSILNRAQGTV